MLTGENGILSKALSATDRHNIEAAKEEVMLKITEYQSNYYTEKNVTGESKEEMKQGDWIFEKYGSAGEKIKTDNYEFTISLPEGGKADSENPYIVKIHKDSNNKLKKDIIGTLSIRGILRWVDENDNITEDDPPITGDIEIKEQNRILTVTVSQVKNGVIKKIKILDPKKKVIKEQEFNNEETEGKIENCVANLSGNYQVVVETDKNQLQKTIMVQSIEIKDKNELEQFRNMVNSGVTFEGDTVTLSEDIDLEGSDTNRNWEAIGKYKVDGSGPNFSGTFDGKNHKISNLYNRNTEIGAEGFFGTILGANIKNLGIESGNIKARNACGGIVGVIMDGTIINCYNKAKIEGGDLETWAGSFGGIVGNARSATIQSCYNIGEIDGYTMAIGGIAGSVNNLSEVETGNPSQILSCYNTGIVKGDYAGGIVGYIKSENAVINNCYNTGDVGGEYAEKIGGLVGVDREGNEVKNSYNIGKIIANKEGGGVIGWHLGTTSKLFFSDTVGADYGIGKNETGIALPATGGGILTDDELKALTNTLNEGQSDTPWKEDEKGINGGYPILSWQ